MTAYGSKLMTANGPDTVSVDAREYLKPLWYWPLAGIVFSAATLGAGARLVHTPLAPLPYVCVAVMLSALCWPAVMRLWVGRGRRVGASGVFAGLFVAWVGVGFAFGLLAGVAQIVHLEGFLGEWLQSVTLPLAGCLFVTSVSTWKAIGLLSRLPGHA